MLDLKQTRVCFLAGTLGQGGAERQLFYMLKALRNADAAPHLLCLTEGEHWHEPIRALGVPITWVGQSAARGARMRTIIKAVRAIKPQIIQSQHFYTNLYAALAARSLGIREIGAVRSGGVHEVIDNGRVLGWLSLNLPRIVAANSKIAVEFAIKQGLPPSRVFFLPNVIDSESFVASPRTPGTTLRLLAVGRLEWQKRMDRLLNLMAQLRQQITHPFKLVIVGDGSLRAQLEAQAHTLGLLPDVVEFRGVVRETAPLYREADIFLLTSDYEGTPNVVMEAMAAGLPIVCTNVGGVPEIMQHGLTGLMFDSKDEAGFLTALIALIRTPTQQVKLGVAASRHIETHHSLTRLPQVFTELYERTLL